MSPAPLQEKHEYGPSSNRQRPIEQSRHRINRMKDILRRADCVCMDVDSTVCQDEAIDELAKFCGVGKEVERMTSKAMNGGITFGKSLANRLDIIKPTLDQIQAYIHKNPPSLTNGVREFVTCLLERGTNVYLVSGGFQSIIIPVAEELGIPDENVFANKLLFYHNGEYADFDGRSFTSETGGKTRVAEFLKAEYDYKNLVFIGDGTTDLETYPTADGFIGFGGNKVRESVIAGAPWFVHSFQELMDVIR